MAYHFGNLTAGTIQKKDKEALTYLFKKADKKMKIMSVVETERDIAFKNLRKLTVELQTKRLRYNSKSACKYFTI